MAFLADNPASRTEAPHPANSGGIGWTVDEARRFLAAASFDGLRLAFQLALVTGLRRGELLGLRWSDIDLDTGRLRVTQHLVVEGGRARLKPVNHKDRRVIAISPRVVEMLAEHRRQQEQESALAGDAWRDGGPAVLHCHGRADHTRAFRAGNGRPHRTRQGSTDHTQRTATHGSQAR